MLLSSFLTFLSASRGSSNWSSEGTLPRSTIWEIVRDVPICQRLQGARTQLDAILIEEPCELVYHKNPELSCDLHNQTNRLLSKPCKLIYDVSTSHCERDSGFRWTSSDKEKLACLVQIDWIHSQCHSKDAANRTPNKWHYNRMVLSNLLLSPGNYMENLEILHWRFYTQTNPQKDSMEKNCFIFKSLYWV